MDATKQFYDLTAESTAEVWYGKDVLMPVIEDFVDLLPDNPKVLDLGCGPGHESMRLASRGADVLGIDFSTECIRVARERCPQCQFKLMDFRQLDVGLKMFDGVFACASLIHISPVELPDILKSVSRVLKNHGYLMTIVRDGKGVRETWPEIDGQKLRRLIYLYSRKNLSNAAFGFEYVKDGSLPKDQIDEGWRSYIFKKAS